MISEKSASEQNLLELKKKKNSVTKQHSIATSTFYWPDRGTSFYVVTGAQTLPCRFLSRIHTKGKRNKEIYKTGESRILVASENIIKTKPASQILAQKNTATVLVYELLL